MFATLHMWDYETTGKKLMDAIETMGQATSNFHVSFIISQNHNLDWKQSLCLVQEIRFVSSWHTWTGSITELQIYQAQGSHKKCCLFTVKKQCPLRFTYFWHNRNTDWYYSTWPNLMYLKTEQFSLIIICFCLFLFFFLLSSVHLDFFFVPF